MKAATRRTSVFFLVSMVVALSGVQRALAQPCGVVTGPDVTVGELAYHPSGEPFLNNFTSSGGLEAFSVATYSCNVGTFWLNWLQSPNANHPVISQNFFRLKRDAAGYNRYEQLGQSWLKHGFFALSNLLCCPSCSATDGTHLGVGCSDPYNATRNAAQSSLGPKWQVNATTGVHIHPVANPTPNNGGVVRLLQIKTTDLEVSDGTQPITSQPRYYVEGQYIAADDAASGNKNNNASYRPITVTGSGSAWTFARIGSGTGATLREKPGVRAWKAFDASVTETDVITPEDGGLSALVIIGGQATDLGGGIYHYEYAIQNLNSDRSIGSFSVPVFTNAAVTNIGFHDVDYHDKDGSGNVTTDGTDWTSSFSGGAVTWSYVNVAGADDNALRWGTLYNFRFDCNLAPVTGNTTLGQFKVANNLTAKTVIPAPFTCPAISIDQTSLPDGDAGVPYSQNLTASGGTAPYTFTLLSGSLPTGLSLSAGGAITGTPSAGTYNFTVQVTDGFSCVGTQAFSITVNCPALAIDQISLPDGDAGVAYSQTLTATGGTGPYTFTLQSGSLPTGLSLSTSGDITGTPSAGAFNFTVQVSDAFGCTATQAFAMNINCPAISIDPASLPDGVAGVAYSEALSAIGGNGPYSFSLLSGSLPSGLTLSGAGVVSGTPSTAGSFNFTVQVLDAFGCTSSQAYSITVTGCALLGDVNVDTFIDGGDVQGFTDCLLTGTSTGNCNCAEMDASTVVDELDIDPFVDLLLL